MQGQLESPKRLVEVVPGPAGHVGLSLPVGGNGLGVGPCRGGPTAGSLGGGGGRLPSLGFSGGLKRTDPASQ